MLICIRLTGVDQKLTTATHLLTFSSNSENNKLI